MFTKEAIPLLTYSFKITEENLFRVLFMDLFTTCVHHVSIYANKG